MKKLLLSMAGLALGFAANATLYVVGDDQGWKIESPTVVELNSNNQYEFVVNKSFKMSTTAPNGSWDVFNSGAKSTSSALEKVQDQTIDLVSSDANINLPYGDGNVPFTVTVNSEVTQASFHGASAPTGEFDKVYLRGNGNWDTCTAANQFSTTDGEHYTMSGVYLTSAFKIADSSWGSINYGLGSRMQLGVETPLTFNADDITVAGMPISNATLEFNLTTHTLKVTGEAEGSTDPGDVYSEWWVNILGPFNGWENNGVQPVDGISTTTDLAIGTQGFKVKVWDGNADIYYISDGNPIPTGQWVQLYLDEYDGAPVQIEGAQESSVYTVKYNCATSQVYVELSSGGSTGGEDGPGGETDYSSWYVNVFGPFNDWTDNGVQPVDGISTTTDLAIGTQGFKIKVWNGDDIYYVNDGTPVELETWTPLFVDITDAPPVQIAGATENSVYTVKFNCATNEVWIQETSSGTVDPNPNPNPETYDAIYVLGAGDGLTWDFPGKKIDGTDNVFTFTVTNLTKFKFSTVEASNWDAFNEGAYSTAYELFNESVTQSAGQTLPIVSWGDDQMMPWTGDYTITIDLNAMTMNVKALSGKPTGPYSIYVRGTMNDWNSSDDWKFAYDETSGNYVFKCDADHIIAAGDEFKFADANWGSVNLGSTDEIVFYNNKAEIMLVGNIDDNMTMPSDFQGTITLTLGGDNTAVAVFDKIATSGISAIETDGNAVYFNLQGVKVQNPEGGIFIKVTDGKAEKVMIRK